AASFSTRAPKAAARGRPASMGLTGGGRERRRWVDDRSRRMISTGLARELRDAGLQWTPIPGDAFQIAGPDFEGDVFHVSDMTIEAHVYPTGTVLGFNGTTEWALDSVALDDALWLPREDQLRDLLRDTFVSLERIP